VSESEYHDLALDVLNDPPPDDDAPCDYCGGDGVLHEDRARGHDHYTVEVPCPECSGGAPFDDSIMDEREPRLPDEDATGLKDPPL
jgi:hypothetical protein